MLRSGNDWTRSSGSGGGSSDRSGGPAGVPFFRHRRPDGVRDSGNDPADDSRAAGVLFARQFAEPPLVRAAARGECSASFPVAVPTLYGLISRH